MGLNKVKQGSNMYQFLNDNGDRGYTWNVIKGKCPHDCSYCYMKRYPQPELHFDEKELKTNLGSGNFIFVGSSCDMWAETIPLEWISLMLRHCRWYEGRNHFLFQSKNPKRFGQGYNFPRNVILGTTIETNRHYPQYMRRATSPQNRMVAMLQVESPKMVSIEPIMDFDLDELTRYIRLIKPFFISIGADSGNNNLPEPSGDKVKALIEALKEFTEVKVKANLKRLL